MNKSLTRVTEKRNKLKEKVDKKLEQIESNNQNLRSKVKQEIELAEEKRCQ